MFDDDDLDYEYEDIEIDDFVVWKGDTLYPESGFVYDLDDDEETITVIRTPTPEGMDSKDLEARKCEVSVFDITHAIVLNKLADGLEVQ